MGQKQEQCTRPDSAFDPENLERLLAELPGVRTREERAIATRALQLSELSFSGVVNAGDVAHRRPTGLPA